VRIDNPGAYARRSDMQRAAYDIAGLARICAATDPAQGADGLIAGLGRLWPDLDFRTVLTRGGWHRLGGVVDLQHRRVADSLRTWAEQQADGDVAHLLDICSGTQLFATRLTGRTHYLTARTGDAAADFVQLEIEELREVLERYLSDPDWLPDSVDEFVDPLDYAQLEPEAVGPPRFALRRMVAVRELVDSVAAASSAGLTRFLHDWDSSTAAQYHRFCDHWAFMIQEFIDSDGEAQVNARPVPAASLERLRPGAEILGAELAKLIHAFDHAGGYPMAWYFHMVASAGVSHTVGAQVRLDLQQGFSYLPERDAQLLERWVEAPYRV